MAAQPHDGINYGIWGDNSGKMVAGYPPIGSTCSGPALPDDATDPEAAERFWAMREDDRRAGQAGGRVATFDLGNSDDGSRQRPTIYLGITTRRVGNRGAIARRRGDVRLALSLPLSGAALSPNTERHSTPRNIERARAGR